VGGGYGTSIVFRSSCYYQRNVSLFFPHLRVSDFLSRDPRITPPTFCADDSNVHRKKMESTIAKKEEQSQQLAKTVQEMQGAMQKAVVEAAKAAASMQAA